MRRPFMPLLAVGVLGLAVALSAQAGGSTPPGFAPIMPLDHPAIQYEKHPVADPIAALNKHVQDGSVSLAFGRTHGYLRAALEALHVPVDSQMLVFSKTSFQGAIIGPAHPRALYFNDQVAIGWVHNGEVLEALVQDPQQGAIFYTLDQEPAAKPQFKRRDVCLSCHDNESTLNVPGWTVGSVFPEKNGMPAYSAIAFTSDHRSPIEDRWGGWYVTGTTGSMKHLGNAFVTNPADLFSMVTPATVNVTSLAGRFNTRNYLEPTSDIVALLVLEHQGRMLDLLTQLGWQTRIDVADHKPDVEKRLAANVSDLVDYLLFVDETPLTDRVKGVSGFTETFEAEGPRDHEGRSLREFDLRTRMMKYRCSYLIYSPAFDGLPDLAKRLVYARMWQVLSGQAHDAKYAHFPLAERRAIVQILRDTKPGLPDYFTEPQ